MKINTLTIFGVGLIGGSIGLAAKRRGIAERVLGVGRRRSGLDAALALGAIDQGLVDSIEAIRQAEMAVFCTPVDCIAGQVLALASACPPGAILTDAGSTKATIVREVDGRLPGSVAFVGSHPLAGSEKRGPEHAEADLFQGRLTVVTPSPATQPAALDRVVEFWRGLGSRVRVMSPEEHDRSLALTSHMPHLVAAALAGILPPELSELTASGFRDTTRIAAGDPLIWSAIFKQNRQAVLDALQVFGERLAAFRRALEASDMATVENLWSQAKKVRDALGS
jgi:prephenate dehydrogenase